MAFAVQLISVFGAYVIAGEIGLAVPFTSGNVSPLWPPAGVALAGVLICGPRVWPAVALGAFVVNFFSPLPHVTAAGIAVGNTLGPLTGAWFLRRANFDSSLRRVRDVLQLTVCGALGGASLTALVGATVLFLTGVNTWSGFRSTALVWWLGDAMGVLIVAPLALTLPALLVRRTRRRFMDLAVLVTGAVVVSLSIFDPRLGLMRAEVFAFGVFPFVLWGAMRFETAGAALVTFCISAIAVWGTAHGFGPFIRGTPLQNVTLLESFLGVTSISGVILAAVIAERAELARQQSAHEALEQSESRYRGIVETAYEGIWKLDQDFNTTFVNPRMAELLGCRVEDMLHRPIFEFLFPSDFEQRGADLQRRRNGVSEHIERRYRKCDGTELWARIATTAIRGADGRFEGALNMVSDITEQKRAEEEAARSREAISLLSEAVEQTADNVFITDAHGTIQYVNPAFELTTGYSRSEVVGKTPRILKSGLHDLEFYRRLWTPILNGQPFRGVVVNRKKSGDLYWTEQSITPIRDGSGAVTHFVSVHKDITELRKQQEQEAELKMAREVQQRFYLGKAFRTVGFDIGTAAHPAAQTGGDYLDIFPLSEGRICLGIGDVSGHGLGSALVMALTRAYVRSFAEIESDPSRVLIRVNKMLFADLDDNRFVTLLLVCLDGRSGCLSYSSAGHNPGFLLNNSGEVDAVLESSGPPLGLFRDPIWATATVPLTAQQRLILLTDGITESTDSEGSEFGVNGVLEYMRGRSGESAHELAEGLVRCARAFAGCTPQEDDMTGIVVKVGEVGCAVDGAKVKAVQTT